MRYAKYKQTGIHWLGQIPESWSQLRLKWILNEVKNLSSTGAETPLSLTASAGIIPFSEKSNRTMESSSYIGAKIVQKGQIVFNRFKARLFAISPCHGIVSPDYAVYSTRILVESKYLILLFSTLRFRQAMDCQASGIGDGFSRLYSGELFKLQIPFPPLPEQRAIVAYLDDKCGKIDELVAAKEKEVELLKELKQTVIADAVTGKGRMENGKWRMENDGYRMKPSGIPWLSQIPEGWHLVRNKSFLRLTDERVGDRKGRFTLLSLTKQGVIIRDLTEGKGKFPKDFDTYLVVRPDNLVFCLFDVDETPRTVGLVRNIGMLTGAYTNFEVNKQIVLPEFAYYYYLQIDDAKKLRPFYTGLRKVVKTNTFLQIRMPVPPLDEQRAIVTYIEEKTAKIDQAVAGLTQQVAALKEYKQRLIADVVTGQMRVA